MKRYFGLMIVLALSACLDETKAEAPVEADNVVASSPSLAAPTPVTPVTQSICESRQLPSQQQLPEAQAAPYAKICDITSIRDVVLNDNPEAGLFLCRTAITYEPSAEAGNRFDSARVKQVIGENAMQGDILGTAGFVGRNFSVLVLNAPNAPMQVISGRDGLALLPVTLQSDEAALLWAYLSGALGRGMGDGFAPEAICNATLETTEQGWRLSNAEIFLNCEPKQRRVIDIHRDGKVTVVDSQMIENSPVLCVD